MVITQFLKAKKLVIMPHVSFNRLASEVSDLGKKKLTFVNMTARCGSTLLSQMISRTPKTQTMSEPWSFVNLHGHYNQGLISQAEYRRLLRSTVKLLCKPLQNREIDHIFIKTTSMMAAAYPMLKEMFPKAKYIFNTRRFKPSVESMMQLSHGLPLTFNFCGGLFKARIFHMLHFSGHVIIMIFSSVFV